MKLKHSSASMAETLPALFPRKPIILSRAKKQVQSSPKLGHLGYGSSMRRSSISSSLHSALPSSSPRCSVDKLSQKPLHARHTKCTLVGSASRRFGKFSAYVLEE